MSLHQASIERAFTELLDRARHDPGVSHEFQTTLDAFLGSASVANEKRNHEMAARRHAEWFLLERPSDLLEVAPVAAFSLEETA
ncbi:MAG TPA: hypothetical protein VM509_13360, partial [Planctomycetota bacterium]|nr:hypothetical protein [Planctomycetota bacterium]